MNKLTRSTLLLLLATLISVGPLPVFAAEGNLTLAPVATYIADDDDEDEVRSESRSYRVKYSSSLRKKINKLDDDPVEDLPLPILFGVTKAQIYSDFGDPRDGGARKHEGQDILAPKGSFIVSPTDAVVIRTGKGSSSGTYVYTMNPGGETFAYMHLQKIAPGIKEGSVLAPGDLIGYVGDTGNAKGGPPHLHFEIRDGRKATDPYPRLTGAFTLQEQLRALTNIVKILKKD